MRDSLVEILEAAEISARGVGSADAAIGVEITERPTEALVNEQGMAAVMRKCLDISCEMAGAAAAALYTCDPDDETMQWRSAHGDLWTLPDQLPVPARKIERTALGSPPRPTEIIRLQV